MEPLRFAVFGDVHGRVALMLTLARRWQQQTGLLLDGILQVGDMGAFPDPGRLDDATARYSRDDPDELGFCDFIVDSPVGRALLADDDTPPVVFCRGNHEDFDYLGRFRRPVTLDPWGKLWFVPDGTILRWSGEGLSLSIAAFGGIPGGPRARPRGRLGPWYTPEQAARAFAAEPGPVDILLTHAGPLDDAWSGGCPDLRALADRLRPRAHLFGHHHRVVGPLDTDRGLLVGLEHLELVGKAATLRPGAWGVLELGEVARFERVDPP